MVAVYVCEIGVGGLGAARASCLLPCADEALRYQLCMRQTGARTTQHSDDVHFVTAPDQLACAIIVHLTDHHADSRALLSIGINVTHMAKFKGGIVNVKLVQEWRAERHR